MTGEYGGVNLRRRDVLPRVDDMAAQRAGGFDDGGVVHAVAGERDLAAVDVADEGDERIAPLQDPIDDCRRPGVRTDEFQDCGICGGDAFIGQCHPQ